MVLVTNRHHRSRDAGIDHRAHRGRARAQQRLHLRTRPSVQRCGTDTRRSLSRNTRSADRRRYTAPSTRRERHDSGSLVDSGFVASSRATAKRLSESLTQSNLAIGSSERKHPTILDASFISCRLAERLCRISETPGRRQNGCRLQPARGRGAPGALAELGRATRNRRGSRRHRRARAFRGIVSQITQLFRPVPPRFQRFVTEAVVG